MSHTRDELVNSFWNKIYENVDDGGYISDDRLLNHYRFLVEKKELITFIEKYTSQDSRKRALDVGCGNGKLTNVMANYFETVDAIDISKEIITKNQENNRNSNCFYYCENLEEFSQRIENKYDFIYVGGVLMYIDDLNLSNNYNAIEKLLNTNAILVLRESVMSRNRVDNINKSYVAYYRQDNYYQNFLDFKLLQKRENLAYRTSELRNVLTRLKVDFLFTEYLYKKLLILLKLKDIFWKPNYNKLINYYYIFRR